MFRLNSTFIMYNHTGTESSHFKLDKKFHILYWIGNFTFYYVKNSQFCWRVMKSVHINSLDIFFSQAFQWNHNRYFIVLVEMYKYVYIEIFIDT